MLVVHAIFTFTVDASKYKGTKMNTSKKINVNFSSLVGLKAELLRKQAEVKEAKMKSEVIHPTIKVKKKPKKRIEKSERDKSEDLIDVDDINTHKKSKLMLEAKTRLYNRLKKSKHNNENFLVDFSNKSDESEEEPLKEEPEDNSVIDNEDDDDDWVEYVDCFGRTRRCLREDLPAMREKDELLKHQMNRTSNAIEKNEMNECSVTEPEKEPEIEVMRRKWEEQTQKLADKANIHYQDVLFDEARTHGVGYYAFSQDEEERIKQQENLANLRKQTEQKQKEMKELKELRTKMEQNRLKAARIRQRIRAGLPAEPTEEEIKSTQNLTVLNVNSSETVVDKDQGNTCNTSDQNPTPRVENIVSEEIVREDKIKALGECLGKRTHWYQMSQEEWVDKCRKARISEFGPMYGNFRQGGYLDPEDKEPEVKIAKENSTDLIDVAANEHMEISQHKDDITTQMPVDATVSESMNEENIISGLRYLREKFEKTHSS